ncbi:MAG: hypothetical protein WBE37_13020 [Bryobacteraceae bacterium]
MAESSHRCRYCGENFIPPPQKPGYVDECPECMHERTRPALPADFESLYMARFPERRKAFVELRKSMLSLGVDEGKVYEILAESLKKAGTPLL